MKHSASQFPEALIEAVRHSRLVPFVGSYVSRQARDKQGHPLFRGWHHLLTLAMDYLRENDQGSEERLLGRLLEKRQPDYYQAALSARSSMGELHWQKFIYQNLNPDFDRLDTSSIDPARAIWDLGSKLVITTTHDRVLGWACPWPNDLGRWIGAPPPRAQELTTHISCRPTIWHMHGFVDDPSQLVFTPRQRLLHAEGAGNSRRYRTALGALQDLLASSTLLFVGFGERDPYFLTLLRKVNDLFHRCGGPHYALVPEKDKQILQARIGELPVTLLTYDKYYDHQLIALSERANQISIAQHVHDPEEEEITQAPTVALRPAQGKKPGEGVQLPPRYQVRDKIGQGGMGLVYLANDRQLDREVAVKVILPSLMSQEADQRFGLEARAIAKLDHPSIVPVYDFGRHNNTVYLTMPMVRGKIMRKIMRKENVTLRQKLEICAELADALDYSHSQGVYHCDIKPENVMVSKEGEHYRLRVMDFGLARLASRKRLKNEDVAGTPLYLSPEQCSSAEVDGRTDLYALGTILYEFLAGEPPFKGPFHSLVYKIEHERPPLFLSRGVEVDGELESLVLRCLAKDPKDRPQRGKELAAALRSYLERRSGRASGSHGLLIRQQHGADAPLVGRDDELSELHLRLDASLAGVCQLAVLGGESGMGKTRLLMEVEKLALENSEPFQVWWGRFPEHEGAMPYQAFSELVTGYFQHRKEKDPLPDLKDLASDLVRLMPALAEIVPLREAAGKVAKKGRKGQDQRFVYDLMARTIRRLSGDRPTVLLMENLNAAGGSLDALQYLVHRLAATPTFIVGTYRVGLPGNHPLHKFLRTFHGDRRFLSLELKPLDETRHRRLVTSLLNGDAVGDDLLDKLFETSEGNPYFTQELVRSLRESGGLVLRDGDTWTLSDEAALHEDALPRNIQEAVEERIKHLPDVVRDTLATASVLGRTFSFCDLEAMETRPQTLDSSLEMLIFDGILEEDPSSRGNAFSFQSKVVREVLYQRFSRRKRRGLHQRYALHLERKFAGKLDRIYPELVYHFAEGDEPEKTVNYAIKQAQRSLDAFAPEDAVRSVEMALGFVRDEGYEGGDLVEGSLCLLLAQAQLGLGNLELGLSESGEAVRAFKKGNDAKGAAEAALLAAETAWRLHKVQTTRRWVENGIVLARTVHSKNTLYGLLTLAAKVANLSRSYVQARAYLEEAEKLAPKSIKETSSGPIPFGGRLITAVKRPLGSLQPGNIQTHEELEFAANIFETLLRVDNDGKVVPLLAEKWEHRYFQTFRFQLHPEAIFSDGERLTARDVKTSLEMVARGSVGRSAPVINALQGSDAFIQGNSPHIEGIEIFDTYSLILNLKDPLPIFPSLLTDRTNAAVFKRSGGGPVTPLLGTGPFCVRKQEAGSLELVRNKTYWRKTLSSLEFVECRVVSDESSMIAGLRSGTLDLGRDLANEQVESMLRTPQFQRGLVECTRKSVGFLLFNRESTYLRSPAVRTALMSMLRIRELVWHSLGRYARPATCLIPPGVLGHDPARRARMRVQGGEAKVFKDNDLETPFTLRAMVHPFIAERYEGLVAGIFREWMTLGVEVKKVPFSREIFCSGKDVPEGIDLVVTRYRGLYDDPDAFTYQLFHSQVGTFGGWCSSDERDRLLEEARCCESSDERPQLYRKIESSLQEDGLVLPLFYDIDCRIACTRLKGVVLHPNAPFVNYSEMGKIPTREPVIPGGIVRVPIMNKLKHLDPAHMPTYDHGEVVPNIFETLTRIGEGAHVEPWLADFHTEDGGRRYYFQLRENIYFHDGRSLTTRDVRYTFERVLRESKLHANLLIPVQGAKQFQDGKAHDIAGLNLRSDHRFTIDLEKPLSFFPGVLSHPALAILAEGSAAPGELCNTYIGTGAFRLSRFLPGERVDLEANFQYWQKGLPKCGRLEFHLGMSPGRVAKAFREERLSLAAGVYPDEAESLRSLGGFRQELSGAPGLSTYFLVFNTKNGPFADRELRRALAVALDIRGNVRETLGGMCLEAGGFIPPDLAGREARALQGDEDHAQTLPPGFSVNAAIHPFFFRQFVRFWDKLTEDMDRLGMVVKPTHRDVIGSLDELETQVDIVAYRWFADYPDADTFVKLLHRKTGLFGPISGTERIDMLIEKGRIETDERLRAEIYAEIEDIIAREALVLPLFHETNYRLAGPKLRGLSTRIGFPLIAYEQLSIEE